MLRASGGVVVWIATLSASLGLGLATGGCGRTGLDARRLDGAARPLDGAPQPSDGAAQLSDGAAAVDGDPARDSTLVNDAGIDAPADLALGRADTGVDGSAFAPCPLVLSGAPVALDFAARTSSRGFVLLDPGHVNASPSRSVHLALHAFVNQPDEGEIQIADLHVPAVWPTAIALDHPARVAGPTAHSAAVGAVTGDASKLIVAYDGHPFGFPGGFELVPIDVAIWSVGAIVQVSQGSWAVPRGIASGSGIGPDSSFVGQGLGVGWAFNAPDASADEILAAVLRTDGTIAVGPWVLLAGSGDAPMRTEVAWSGTTYLFAQACHRCAEADPLCRLESVTIVRVATGDGAATLQLASTFPTPGGKGACCPTLAAYGGVVWAAWYETVQSDGGNTRNLRLVRLSPEGVALDSVVTVADATSALSRIAMAASRLGVLLAWLERGTGSAGSVQLRQFGPDGAAIGTATSIDTDLSVSDLGIDVAAVENPPGMLIGWAANLSRDHPIDTTWLARVECAAR